MTPKQLQSMMIKRRSKAFDTKGERDFAEFAKKKGFYFIQNVKEFFPNTEHGPDFEFQMDFVRKGRFDLVELDIEIDGKGHKEKWDYWKDAIKNQNHVKVIHIGAELCKRKYWDYLEKELQKALASESMVVYIYK